MFFNGWQGTYQSMLSHSLGALAHAPVPGVP
jgi:hypothetical protein